MNQIWHVYYATKGTAGAYIDALLKASQVAGVDSCAFVSSNYRFRFGKLVKCFFPITDYIEKRRMLLTILRGFELTLAYLYILILALFSRPVIVIHLIDDFTATYFFFKMCQLIGLQVRVTCHDVNSHYGGINSNRTVIITKADELVIHNEAAEKTLIESFGEKVKSKIRQYSFPYSAYEEILSKDRIKSAETLLRRQLSTGYYLFLGVVRRSKGIETLIEAWQRFNKDKRQKLVVAGKWTDPGDQTRRTVANDDSIISIDRYISDEEFVQLIQDAKFVILPYHNYAHSAIVSSCANHGGAVIISDIELFTKLLPNYPLTFKQGDVHSLVTLLKQTEQLPAIEIKKLKLELSRSVEKDNRNLVEDLKVAYGGKT